MDKGAIEREITQDETIIEGWARVLIQNALKCLNEEKIKTASFLGLAKGILFMVPDRLGTLLGVHVGSALGFYRKSDGYWGLPVVYQVESETPIKWDGTALLIIVIGEEKTQASMVLTQWSCPLAAEIQGIMDKSLLQVMDGKNFFWSSPGLKDFPKEVKLKFHFNREINEEFYGQQNVRAIDIFFDPYDVPPCMKKLCEALNSYPQIKE
jgi:lipid-binding SYLF domain-containing protein